MKIALFGFAYYHYTEGKKNALERLGHEVLYYENTEEVRGKIDEVKRNIIDYKPDLFINYCCNYSDNLIDITFLNQLKDCKKVTMFADSIRRVDSIEQNYSAYDNIIIFESTDLEYLCNKYNISKKKILQTRAAVTEEYYCQNINSVIDEEFDLCFIGLLSPEREEFFEEIAKFSFENNIKLVLYGHFWHNKHWWQSIFSKRKFAKKHPYLSKYVVNQYRNPKEAADLYKKTKICLNKHITIHTGINSRTLEIMGNNNFVLCDYKEDADEFSLIDDVNISFYHDVEECKQKILYYLSNEDKRKLIGRNGGELVRAHFTMTHDMKRLINAIFDKEVGKESL